MERRGIVIFHPDFDPDTPEAIELAQEFARGMREMGRSLVPAIVDDLQRDGVDIQTTEAQQIAMGFEYRILKVQI